MSTVKERIKNADTALLVASSLVFILMVIVLAAVDFSPAQRADVKIIGSLLGLTLWMMAFIGRSDQTMAESIIDMHEQETAFGWSKTTWHAECPYCGADNELNEGHCMSGSAHLHTCSKCGKDYTFRAGK